jgi:hypothetical protein
MPLTIFVLPVSVVVILFVLTGLLFSRLEMQHPAKYQELGSPSFRGAKNKGFDPIVATLRFIVRREHRALNDSYLSNVSDSMLVCFAIYLVLFVCIIFVTTAQHGWRGSRHAI